MEFNDDYSNHVIGLPLSRLSPDQRLTLHGQFVQEKALSPPIVPAGKFTFILCFNHVPKDISIANSVTPLMKNMCTVGVLVHGVHRTLPVSQHYQQVHSPTIGRSSRASDNTFFS